MSDYRIEGRPQTIFRTIKDPDNPYVQIDRRPLDNDQLSFKAKGILTYLMSRPDGWQVNIEDLINRSTDGKSAIRSGIKELKDAGHIRYKELPRDTAGQFTGTVIEVYEVPDITYASEPDTDYRYVDEPDTDYPHAENPHTGKPEYGKSHTSIKELSSNKNNKKEAVSGSAEAEPPKADGFDIMKEYTDFTGNLVSSLYLAQELELIESEYPEDWIIKAFRLSAEKKSLSYAKSILKRWKAEGGPTNDVKRKPDQTAPQEPRKYDIPEGYDGGAQAEKQTPLQSAWTEFTDAIRFMYDAQVKAAVEARIKPVSANAETGVLTIAGDRAYYDYAIKMLTNAAKYAGFTLDWWE